MSQCGFSFLAMLLVVASLEKFVIGLNSSNCCADMPGIVANLQAENDKQQKEIDDLKAQLKKVTSQLATGEGGHGGTGRCPSDYSLLPGGAGCYKLNGQKSTWNAAFSSCAAEGANLAIITSQQQQAAIADFLRSLGGTPCERLWIGMQRQDPNSCTTPMKWKTSDGKMTSLTYTNWQLNPAQPDCSGGGDRCVEMYNFAGADFAFWNDNMCSRQQCYLCQM